jgi:hypothetical protein
MLFFLMSDGLMRRLGFPRLRTLLCMGGISMSDQYHTLSRQVVYI